MAITGVHAILHTNDAVADRAFFADLLGLASVDAGEGWLIFALPPAEVAVHPTGGPPQHELYLMCDDVEATVAELTERGVTVEGGVSDEGWGLLTTIRLPGGGTLGLYQPRHEVAANRPAEPSGSSGSSG
jgi:predicted enzyme related to lactoylglutathione lyase